MPAPTDPGVELAERIRSGDREALGELYDRDAGIALALAIRVLGDRQLAEDVVHDAFVTVWQKIGGYTPDRGAVRSWLLAIVRNRAIDRLRAARPSIDPSEADELSLLRTGPNLVSDAVEERLARETVRRAIASLPYEQRHAIELAYFGGLTYREVAARTGVPVGTANGRLRMALAKLRDALADDVASASTVATHASAARAGGRAAAARLPAMVLVVDDEAIARDAMREALEHEGFLTRTAEDGHAAVELLRGGLRPSVIILDLMMPTMNGAEFARWLTQTDGMTDIPFVVSTGYDLPDEAPELERADAVLAKPPPMAELLAAVQRRCNPAAASA